MSVYIDLYGPYDEVKGFRPLPSQHHERIEDDGCDEEPILCLECYPFFTEGGTLDNSIFSEIREMDFTRSELDPLCYRCRKPVPAYKYHKFAWGPYHKYHKFERGSAISLHVPLRELIKIIASEIAAWRMGFENPQLIEHIDFSARRWRIHHADFPEDLQQIEKMYTLRLVDSSRVSLEQSTLGRNYTDTKSTPKDVSVPLGDDKPRDKGYPSVSPDDDGNPRDEVFPSVSPNNDDRPRDEDSPSCSQESKMPSSFGKLVEENDFLHNLSLNGEPMITVSSLDSSETKLSYSSNELVENNDFSHNFSHNSKPREIVSPLCSYEPELPNFSNELVAISSCNELVSSPSPFNKSASSSSEELIESNASSNKLELSPGNNMRKIVHLPCVSKQECGNPPPSAQTERNAIFHELGEEDVPCDSCHKIDQAPNQNDFPLAFVPHEKLRELSIPYSKPKCKELNLKFWVSETTLSYNAGARVSCLSALCQAGATPSVKAI